MPNYCSNYLYIEGNHNTLKEIIRLVKSDKSMFDFEKIVPMPGYIYQGILGQKEKELYGENNWYDWSVKNWGTKWNSVDAELYDEEFYFLTAWSPCEPVIETLAKLFPTMRFEYTFEEPGMAFCGKRVYENGEIIFYYDGNYCENPACEDDEWADEYALTDTSFPIKNSGFTEAIEITDRKNQYISGKLYFREYENNRIYRMTDGNFIATKDFQFQYIDEQTCPDRQAA